MVDGKVRHFGVVGFANGLAVMADEETRSYWDHITGEAFLGPLRGTRLPTWPVQMTTVAAARAEHPGATLSLSTFRSARAWILARAGSRSTITGRGFLPPPFRMSMHDRVDQRMPDLEQGLGVVVGSWALFVPAKRIGAGGVSIEHRGRLLQVRKGNLDGVPVATWADDEQVPMQLLTRWYGFSFTYPRCEVYRPAAGATPGG